jgi:hypothetical protein
MFRSSDGARWTHMSAGRLAALPIWKGNRNVDETHALRISQSIQKTITELDISPYRIVTTVVDGEVCKYIVDGQHRITILRDYFKNPDADDFLVIVIDKECESEKDIIEYFGTINRTKAMYWREDPVLAANNYIAPFLKEFNKDPKKPLIRSGKVNKPYMSVDRLREVLIEKHVVEWRTLPTEFVARCREINDSELEKLDTTVSVNKRAKEMKFSLGLLDFKFL